MDAKENANRRSIARLILLNQIAAQVPDKDAGQATRAETIRNARRIPLEIKWRGVNNDCDTASRVGWQAESRSRTACSLMLLSGIGFVASAMVTACAPNELRGDVEVEQKIANARTRADHEALASRYDQQASASRVAADKHKTLSASYDRVSPWSLNLTGLNAAMAQHCDSAASNYRKAAEESSALAKLHRELADKATE